MHTSEEVLAGIGFILLAIAGILGFLEATALAFRVLGLIGVIGALVATGVLLVAVSYISFRWRMR